jgi:hypothetical protein
MLWKYCNRSQTDLIPRVQTTGLAQLHDFLKGHVEVNFN